MNKIERVMSALRGGEVDRPPFSFWYHFGLQHMPGRVHAEAEVGFYRAYDLDFLKVMNDYPYPLQVGLDSIETEDDWKRIERVKPDDRCWQDQLTALSEIQAAIGKEALFIDTIFSPWTTARRMCGRLGLIEWRKRNPELVLRAMANIADSLAGYAGEAIKRGASGIFLSLGAATDDVMSPDEYREWGRPFDLKILEAVQGAPFNVLHIHGSRIHFNHVMDYPAAALNWSHHIAGPSLADGKAKSGKAVLGGINEATAAHSSPGEIRDEVARTLGEVGRTGLLVTPGCSVPTDTPERTLRAIQSAIEQD